MTTAAGAGSAVSRPLGVVILAAGFGTRMRSETHKVLHELAGVPMAEHVIRAARALGPDRMVVIVGHSAEQVQARLAAPDVEFVHQERQLGTAHAYLQAAPLLEPARGRTLVLSGDGALLTPATLAALVAVQGDGPGMTVLTCRVPDPSGLGRVLKDGAGLIERIVEDRDATPGELLVNEINVGTYIFDERGFELARSLSNDNAAGEYYITDLIAAYRAAGLPVRASDTPLEEYAGPNDRAQLAQAERVLRDRIRRRWLLEGVTMHAPETVFIDETVELAPDVTIEPFVIIRGNTRVARGAHIGSHSLLEDAAVPERAVVAPYSKL